MAGSFEKADKFRRLARELLQIAGEADDPEDRVILEETAREYERIADAQEIPSVKLHS